MTFRRWSESAPLAGQGYHRVAYRLLFEDGREYHEIFRLTRNDPRFNDLRRLIRDHLEAVLSRAGPTRRNRGRARTQLLLNADRPSAAALKEAAELLERYAL